MTDTWEQPSLLDHEPPKRAPLPETTICDHCQGRGIVPYRPKASAPARNTDPHTSQDAADRLCTTDVSRFSARSRQARLLEAFRRDDLTDQEATEVVLRGETDVGRSAFDGCRRRCSDLRAAEFLADSGARRKNPGSPDDAVVWTITTRGIVACRQLEATGWSR